MYSGSTDGLVFWRQPDEKPKCGFSGFGRRVGHLQELDMVKIVKNWMGFKSDKRGVTALEYGLIAAVVAVVMVVGASTLGNKLSNQFSNISTNLK